MLYKTYPGLRLIVSFADPEHGHVGGIYQGGNWIYAGRSATAKEYIYRGRRWQGRSFRNQYSGMEHHPDVQIIQGSSKHRYLMPLDPELITKIETLRQPFPKRERS
jgi:hypothetical protein